MLILNVRVVRWKAGDGEQLRVIESSQVWTRPAIAVV